MTAPEIHAQGSRRETLHVWSSTQTHDLAAKEAVCQWMEANGVAPKDIVLAPITLEFVPGCAGSITSCTGTSRAPWWIAYTHRFRNTDGDLEVNVLTGHAAEFQRTIPLTVEPPSSLVPEWATEKVHQEEPPAPIEGEVGDA